MCVPIPQSQEGTLGEIPATGRQAADATVDFEVRVETPVPSLVPGARILDLQLYDDIAALGCFELVVMAETAEIRDLAPGHRLSLWLPDPEDPDDRVCAMSGRLASISPEFLAAGRSTVRLRVVELLSDYTQIRLTGSFTGSEVDLIAQICRQLQLPCQVPQQAGDKPIRRHSLEGWSAVALLVALARDFDMSVRVEAEGNQPRLEFAPNCLVAAPLDWPNRLNRFAPAAWTRCLPAKPADKLGTTPFASGSTEIIEPPKRGAIPKTLFDQSTGRTLTVETNITDLPLPMMRHAPDGAITASGEATGRADLRKGAWVDLVGLGDRYSGTYQITSSRHRISPGAYSTSFNARKEVFDD